MLDCGRDGRRASSGGNPRLRITYVNTTVQKLGLLYRCGLRDNSYGRCTSKHHTRGPHSCLSDPCPLPQLTMQAVNVKGVNAGAESHCGEMASI